MLSYIAEGIVLSGHSKCITLIDRPLCKVVYLYNYGYHYCTDNGIIMPEKPFRVCACMHA